MIEPLLKKIMTGEIPWETLVLVGVIILSIYLGNREMNK